VVTLPKPSAIFDREHEWDDLCRFVTEGSPGLRLGVVRGRRRHGKSFLLEHLCRAVDGVYTLALRQSRAMALARFGDGVSRAIGYRLGRFDDWPAAVWDRSRETFSRMIAGAHFEELAREWVRWYGRETGLDDIGQVGSTVVACREHRGHEVDVVALSRDSRPRSRGARITLVGEAKSTNQRLTTSDSRRLRHILDLLAAQGYDVEAAGLALFSRVGFSAELAKAASATGVRLVDLQAMYGQRPPAESGRGAV
jgi:hypothetical protein